MSQNTQLIGSYVSSGATATASSTATGYDPTNAVTLNRQSLWVSNSTGASWLQFDLGSAKTVDSMFVGNHNGDAWTGAILEYSSDLLLWTDSGASFSGIVSTADFYATFTSQSKQYWRLRTTSATSAMQVGVLYLGVKTVLTLNPSYPLDEEDLFNVERKEAYSGAIVATQYGRMRERFTLTFPDRTSADRDQVRTFLRTENGPLRPFVYVPADESGAGTHGQAFLVRSDPLSNLFRRNFSNAYQYGLTLVEEA